MNQSTFHSNLVNDTMNQWLWMNKWMSDHRILWISVDWMDEWVNERIKYFWEWMIWSVDSEWIMNDSHKI